jgi:serine/threonine-protein kinase HipA
VSSKERSLTVLLAGQIMGRVEQNQRGRFRFIYDPGWRGSSGAVPLSLSMPLVAAEHDQDAVEAFMCGLLPDNRDVLAAWGRRFQVSPRNPFALLTYVGEDCAGAVQFVREERLDHVLNDRGWEVDWLDDAGVETRLRALRGDRSAWRASGDTGQFSLAGAQSKIALLRQDEKWGIPSGRAPTTHILKPAPPELDGHAENEHFCLELARQCSLPTATSRVTWFGNEAAIVVERYDRAFTAELAAAAGTGDLARALATLARTQPILRLHQEDLCQAMGLMPTAKYQNEGGPTPAQIAGLLRAHSSRPVEDVQVFVDALAFNWLVAGTDAHAKNYSLLHGGGGRVRLAPLYDLASLLPYPQFDIHRARLAMKVGGKYRLRDIGERQWRKLAVTLGLDPDQVTGRVARMTERLPDAVADVRRRARADGLTHVLVERLADQLMVRAEDCRDRNP